MLTVTHVRASFHHEERNVLLVANKLLYAMFRTFSAYVALCQRLSSFESTLNASDVLLGTRSLPQVYRVRDCFGKARHRKTRRYSNSAISWHVQ